MGRTRFFASFIILCLFLPFSPVKASAQENVPIELSLDEAVALALEYNLNLKKIRIDLATGGYSEKHLWSLIFPSISADTSVSYTNSLFSGVYIPTAGVSYSLGLSMSLPLNAGIPYAMRSIKLAHQGNILRYEDACNQLSILITKNFYSLIAEKNNLLLLEEVLNLAQATYERNQISFRNGLIGELVLMQSALAYENARYSLSAANTAYENSMAEFLAMLGIDSGSNVMLLGEVSIVKVSADPETLIRNYLYKRPDIVRIIQEIEGSENTEKQRAVQSRAPSLNLSFNWSSSNFDPFADRYSASARLSIPIDSWIPGTTGSQSINTAKNTTEKARLDLAIAEDSAKTQIRSLTANLQNSWDSILIARLGYETAQRTYQLTEQGFNSGTVESLRLEDARNNMASARYRLLQSELAYLNMILNLSAAVNVDWKNLIETYGAPSE